MSFPAGRRPLARRPTSHPGTLLAVAVGGAGGAVLRWALDATLTAGQGWPWVTLLINVLGSAALAWLVVHGERHRHPHWLRPAVGTGLLGGFTTFSVFAVQSTGLAQQVPALALAYLVATPVLCVAAVFVVGTLTRSAGRVRR